MSEPKTAVLYRMVLPDHTCPFGVRAKELLTEHGYQVDDNVPGTREATDRFQEEHGVSQTPQVFIGGERIGGSDDLQAFLAAR